MRVVDAREMDRFFDWIGELMGCDEQCNQECVFPDVGTRGCRCPINEFRDRVEEAIERKEAR